MAHHHFTRPALGVVLMFICAIQLWLRQRPVVLPIVGIIIGALLVAVTTGMIDRMHRHATILGSVAGAGSSIPISVSTNNATLGLANACVEPSTARLTVRPIVGTERWILFPVTGDRHASSCAARKTAPHPNPLP